MNLEGRARDVFDVKVMTFPKTKKQNGQCLRAYAGVPDWVDDEDEVTTTNFAKAICAEIARLTTLGTKVQVEGSRGDYLQEMVDRNYYNLRKWVEYACAAGTVILKPNGTDIECITTEDFLITDTYNGEIWGGIFVDRERSGDGKTFYTRLEYHRFEGEGDEKRYVVTNKCFVGETVDDVEEEADIAFTPWSMLAEEVSIQGLERPLFAVINTPHANALEENAPVSPSIIAVALRELRDLDIAYSRNAVEIEDSKRTVLIDSDRLMIDGGTKYNKNTRVGQLNTARENMGLPKYVKAVEGEGQGNIYNEINPTLNTQTRIEGMNALLSQIGYKIGFSNGYFVFNQRMGIQTATGVEADQQRTIQFIKDCRDMLEKAVTDILYALNAFADLYDLAPGGDYEVTLDFGDLVYNREEDKARWLQYVQMGKVPFWYFLTKFEGMTEEEAKALEQEAMQAGLQALYAQQSMVASE